jgi:hypothetical protein
VLGLSKAEVTNPTILLAQLGWKLLRECVSENLVALDVKEARGMARLAPVNLSSAVFAEIQNRHGQHTNLWNAGKYVESRQMEGIGCTGGS